MSNPVAYLCVTPIREGQAGFTHVHQIIKGLRSLGRKVDLYAVPAEAAQKPLLVRISYMLSTQLRLVWSLSAYEVLYLRSHIMALPSVVIAKIFNIPIVLEVNGPYEDLFLAWPFTKYFSGILIYLIKVQMRLSNNIIAVTPQLRDWVIAEIEEKDVVVIENGADIDHFSPEAISDYHFEKEYVIFFGALAVWQGIEDILKAASHDKWPNDLLLVIAGEGMLEEEVIQSEKDNENIRFLGVVPYHLVPGLVADSMASLVCKNNLGRRSETGLSPLKMFESLACGVPVIVTDLPGLSTFVEENDCGVVVPMNSPVSIAEAVARLHVDKDLRVRLGLNGLKVVTEKHSWNLRAVDTDRVIQNAIASV